MSRPKVHDDRVSMSIRLPRALHDRLRRVSDERVVSANLLVTKALDGYLSTLVQDDAP